MATEMDMTGGSGGSQYAPREHEHPVMAAARRAGANPDELLRSRDLRGLIDAALKGNPQLSTDSGMDLVEEFANSFKREFNMTERELPNARAPGNMPNASFGSTGRPAPLRRPDDYGQPQEGILGRQIIPPSRGILGQ